MSNALAIGAVTAVIKSVLENGLAREGITSILGEPIVTVLPPNPDDGSGGTTNRDRLNLFLYQTTPNSSWRNVGLPSRNSNGDRLSNPPLALDLHYLLTAYSKQSFHAEILLGYAMQILHETSVLTRDTIRTALQSLASSVEPAFKALATSDLADQVEQIKLAPQVMSTEEMSKLWSAIQTQYRPTTVYQVSVVLIESHRSVKSALPVLQRNVFALPVEQPVIETLVSAAGTNQPIVMGSTIVIKGAHLKTDATKVRLGAIELPVQPPILEERQITVPLASPPLAAVDLDGLRAGIQPVQVIQELILNTPGDPHRGFESNVEAFVLRPAIRRNPDGSAQIQLSGVQTLPNRPAFRAVTIALIPIVGKDQRVRLLLNQWGGTRAFSFDAEPRSDDRAEVVFHIPTDLAAGTYLVRVQVDGAESLLDVDTNPASPTYQQFSGTPRLILSP